jgi:peptidylprolyl isomerase
VDSSASEVGVVEPEVAAVGSDLLVADANTSMAMPTTPTIHIRLATGSILAGLHPGTTAPWPVRPLPRIRSQLMAERPTITIPDNEPPADLLIEDETIGDGEEAVTGKRVYVHYAGVAWSSGDEFDASWNRGDVFDFRLGAREVIEGWDKGVAGMRVGGRRRLTIPPHLGYGSRGAGGVIKGGETLVFVVDLVNVR